MIARRSRVGEENAPRVGAATRVQRQGRNGALERRADLCGSRASPACPRTRSGPRGWNGPEIFSGLGGRRDMPARAWRAECRRRGRRRCQLAVITNLLYGKRSGTEAAYWRSTFGLYPSGHFAYGRCPLSGCFLASTSALVASLEASLFYNLFDRVPEARRDSSPGLCTLWGQTCLSASCLDQRRCGSIDSPPIGGVVGSAARTPKRWSVGAMS